MTKTMKLLTMISCLQNTQKTGKFLSISWTKELNNTCKHLSQRHSWKITDNWGQSWNEPLAGNCIIVKKLPSHKTLRQHFLKMQVDWKRLWWYFPCLYGVMNHLTSFYHVWIMEDAAYYSLKNFNYMISKNCKNARWLKKILWTTLQVHLSGYWQLS